ncbi:lysophospholipid acyltransferase family protein [Yoonia sp. SS1-5]|uniref:Lysophospholipid acyltransferase family protein n=1 Tax=Yoonia rhodophyticola TaxID=3137370 RepID=A0AAN0MB24_9RHOB
MAETWQGPPGPDLPSLTWRGWVRVIRRGLPLGILVFGGLVILIVLRLIERPIYGAARPLTPYITQFVCRGAFVILGIRYQTIGAPMPFAGAVVANHSSWLDIFALNARKRIYFVAKSEVAGWPGIGWLARATGTIFVKRDRREAAAQIATFKTRLAAGHKLLFFPEGTSTDGMQVLPFKTTLFAAFFDPELAPHMHLQAVTLIYQAAAGEDPRFYGWWGDMEFGPHLLATLAAERQGDVIVHYHDPVKLTQFADRKALASHLEVQVRSGLAAHRGMERLQG